MELSLVIAAGTAGAMLGNIFWYLAARALGIQRLRPFIDRYGRWLTMSWGEVERAERWFRVNGVLFVFLGRMLPTVRSLVSVPAGLLKMRFKRFAVASTIGTAGWTALLAGAGFRLRRDYGAVDLIIGPLSTAILVLLAGVYLWRVATHSEREQAEKKSDLE
jgi:membrane protein DedA with SNARE-associated domain